MPIVVRYCLNAVLLLGCLAAGLGVGPRIRTFYEFLFPQPSFTRGDFSALYEEAGKPVVIFTTSTCPYCRRARELLRDAHVDFKDFVIDQSETDEKRFSALGGTAVPMLFIADRRIVGYREDTIRESLAGRASSKLLSSSVAEPSLR